MVEWNIEQPLKVEKVSFSSAKLIEIISENRHVVAKLS